MRSSFDITLAEIKHAYSDWDKLRQPAVEVDPIIVEYAKTHSKRECYLYNNRIFFGYVNPSQRRKDEYDANWRYINQLPAGHL